MLKIEAPTATGFETVVMNERFKCAFITHSAYYSFGKVDHMKRHNNTDEIFVLLFDSVMRIDTKSGESTSRVIETGAEELFVTGEGTLRVIYPAKAEHLLFE